MTAWINGAAAGTNGVTVTAGNSGGSGDDGFTSVNPNGGSIIFDNSHPAHGSLSYKVTGLAGAACYVEKDVAATLQYAQRFYVYFTVLPTAAMAIRQFRSATGQVLTVGINTVGKLLLQNAAGMTIWTATNPITINNQWRIEAGAIVGADTSHGSLTMTYYAGDSLTQTDTSGPTTNGLDAGVAPITIDRAGKLTGSFTSSWWMDDLGGQPLYAYLGAVGITAPAAPTATATAGVLSIAVGGTDSGTTGGSAITGRTWNAYTAGAPTVVAGTTGPAAATTGTITGLVAGGVYTVRESVNNGFYNSPFSAATAPVTVLQDAVAPGPMNVYTSNGTGMWIPKTKYRSNGTGAWV